MEPFDKLNFQIFPRSESVASSRRRKEAEQAAHKMNPPPYVGGYGSTVQKIFPSAHEAESRPSLNFFQIFHQVQAIKITQVFLKKIQFA